MNSKVFIKKTDISYMRNHWKSLFLSLIVCFSVSCNNNSGSVNTTHKPPAIKKPLTTIGGSTFFGGYFSPVNSRLYELLLSSCKRCGEKRIHDDGSYTRHYTFFKSDPKRCENWLQEGYFQIEFEKKVLPAPATVYIQPRYRDKAWGEAFAVKGTARPINENKGFNIQIFPNQGLGGSYNMSITSQGANPSSNQLDITVHYGRQEDNSEMIYVPLSRLQGKAVDAVFTCSQYTN